MIVNFCVKVEIKNPKGQNQLKMSRATQKNTINIYYSKEFAIMASCQSDLIISFVKLKLLMQEAKTDPKLSSQHKNWHNYYTTLMVLS